jgi:polysaccharide pyruvyl transferase WcaK-like protein
MLTSLADVTTTEEFKCLLRKQPSVSGEGHIIDEPIRSVDDLVSQIAATDIVVATRFHNILLAFAVRKASYLHLISSQLLVADERDGIVQLLARHQ